MPVVLLSQFPKDKNFVDESITFENISIEDGLSQSSIFSICQDNFGFMWFGTFDGLNKYDGYDFRVFGKNPNNSNSISHNIVRAILADKNGNIWIGTHDGLTRFDRRSYEFKIFRWEQVSDPNKKKNFVTSLYEDSNGRIWVGTDNGLSYYDPDENNIFVYSIATLPLKSKLKSKINSIFEDSNNNLWIGSDNGMILIRHTSEKARILGYELGKLIGNVKVNSLVNDRHNNFWIGTQKGLIKYDFKSGNSTIYIKATQNKYGLTDSDVSSLMIDSKGQVWIGTKSGLNVYVNENNSFSHFLHSENDDQGLSNNYILSLYEDRGGVIWIGTFNGGINKYNPLSNNFHKINKRSSRWSDLSEEIIYGITEDSQGYLWLGTDSRGLNRIDKNTGKVKVFNYIRENKSSLSDDHIRSLFCDTDDNIWVGTLNGLNKFSRESEKFIRYKRNLLPPYKIASDTIVAITQLKSGDMLFGTYGKGVYRISKKSGQINRLFSAKELISENNFTVQDILEDSNGDIWIGTYGEGMIYYNSTTHDINIFKNNPTDNKTICNNFIFSLHEDQNKNIWIGTAGSGMDKYDRAINQFTHFSDVDGLPNNFVYGILEDGDGKFWLSTNKGLSKFDPKFAGIKDKTKAIINFDVSDGISSNEFNFGSYFKNSSGELFFGSIKGLTWFQPEEVKRSNYKPSIVITSLKILNKQVLPGKDSPLKQCMNTTTGIELSYLDYAFSFEFAALDFGNPLKNKYAYKMEGVDNDWIYTDAKQRLASYTNLDGGTYTFKVTGTNSSGIWNETAAKIMVTIIPAFWQTAWFKVISILLVIGLIIVYYLIRMKSIEKHNIQLQKSNMKLNREIDERIKAENDLKESEEKYRIFVERANDGIVIIQDMVIKYLNPQLAKILGQKSEEILGKKFQEFVHPDEIVKSEDRYARGILGENIETFYESRLMRKDGTVIFVELNASLITYEDQPAIMVFIREIGERLKLEEHIRQIQKMEAIGQLAGGVAHDFNNILTIINGNAELLLMQMDESDPYYKPIEEIKSSGNRAANLTRQLLGFSRRQIINPRPLNINDILVNMDKMLRRLIGEHIEMQLHLQQNLPLIKADPGQIEQIVMNLMINARDAVIENKSDGQPERITLATTLFEISDPNFAKLQGLEPGIFVQISISDTGIGMTQEVADKIFEPFFTTKDTGKGTGLGLSTVFGIIKQNNGSINVYSELGVGTAIKIFWPATTEIKKKKRTSKDKEKSFEGNEKLLIVEDDRGVREFACSIMKKLGYEVHGEPNGKTALEYLKNNKNHPDLIITDLIMPEMNGKELAIKANKLNKKIKIIFTSGYTDDFIVQDGTLEEGVEFLQKPYSLRNLSAIIREVLDKK